MNSGKFGANAEANPATPMMMMPIRKGTRRPHLSLTVPARKPPQTPAIPVLESIISYTV